MKNNTRKLTLLGLLIALQVVLTRFLSIQTPIIRIGFSFLPVALASMIFGPVLGGIAATIADVLGMMIFPTGGAYFPGFTLSAFLSGFIYGIFLYQKPKTMVKISLAVIVHAILVNIVLNSLWVHMITGNAIVVLLPARVIKALIMIPIETIMIKLVWDRVVIKLPFAKNASSLL